MRMHPHFRQNRAAALVAALGTLIATVNFAHAQPIQPEILFSFTNGPAQPYGALVQGNDGSFYGTTAAGGTSNYGTVFQVTTEGVFTTLVRFACTNGATPYAGLTLGNDGNFYGTTRQGGTYDGGTVFQMTTNGTLTTLYSFGLLVVGTNGDEFPDGVSSSAPLALGMDGNFYGTTDGGAWLYGGGTVFRITPSGSLTTLANFDGWWGPQPKAGMVLGSDGNLYGSISNDGSGHAGHAGTMFQVTTSGVFTTFASFASTNGYGVNALALGSDGNFYGTTGADGDLGTVFQVTTNGVLTTLVSFDGKDGAFPEAGLALGSDGNFYGTTVAGGGVANAGTVFQVTTNGILTALVSFTGTNGERPSADLTLGRDGNFYGTTTSGGPGGGGVIYRLRHGASIQSFGMKTNGFQLNTLNVGGSGWVVLESSSDLTTWTPVQTNGTGAAQQFLDPAGVAQPRQFYRVRQQ